MVYVNMYYSCYSLKLTKINARARFSHYNSMTFILYCDVIIVGSIYAEVSSGLYSVIFQMLRVFFNEILVVRLSILKNDDEVVIDDLRYCHHLGTYGLGLSFE